MTPAETKAVAVIIQTRYRDIAAEELEHPLVRNNWPDRRWKTIHIETPQVDTEKVVNQLGGQRHCDGPFYRIVPYRYWAGCSRPIAVCPHIAEIGD